MVKNNECWIDWFIQFSLWHCSAVRRSRALFLEQYSCLCCAGHCSTPHARTHRVAWPLIAIIAHMNANMIFGFTLSHTHYAHTYSILWCRPWQAITACLSPTKKKKREEKITKKWNAVYIARFHLKMCTASNKGECYLHKSVGISTHRVE